MNGHVDVFLKVGRDSLSPSYLLHKYWGHVGTETHGLVFPETSGILDMYGQLPFPSCVGKTW